MTEDENKILIDIFTFDSVCKNNEGKIDDILDCELFEMLINMFEKNGYETYKNDEIYVENGQYKRVQGDIVVAILEK